LASRFERQPRHLACANLRDGEQLAADAQPRDEDGRRRARLLWQRREAREPVQRPHPDRALAVGRADVDEVRREAVGRRVVPDAAGLNVETVEAASRAEVDAPERVFSNARHLVARKSLARCVGLELRALGVGVVNARHAAARSSNPQAALAVEEEPAHEVHGHAVGRREVLEAATAMAYDAGVIETNPEIARAVLGEGGRYPPEVAAVGRRVAHEAPRRALPARKEAVGGGPRARTKNGRAAGRGKGGES